MAKILGAAIYHQGQMDNTQMMSEQLHAATLTEQKMASIITWLFEVIGSGDGQEHKAEIQEMRDTFIRAHYGVDEANEGNYDNEITAPMLNNDAVNELISGIDNDMQLQDLQDGGAERISHVEESIVGSNVGAKVHISRRGSITIQPNMKQLEMQSATVAEEAWTQAFANADKNSDGTISASEFKKWFLEQQQQKADKTQAFV